MNAAKKLSMCDKIEKYLLMYVILWSVTPFLQLNVSPIGIIMCVTIFIGIKILSYGTISTQQVFMLVWFAFILLYRIMGFSTAAFGNYYMLFITFWFIFPLQYYLEYMDLKQKKFIINYTFIVILLNGIYNLFLNFWHRDISAEINFTRKFDKYNVWGTDSIQNVVLLVGAWFICYYVSYQKRKLLSRGFYYILFVCICLYLFITSRMTSVLLFGMACVLFHWMFVKSRAKKWGEMFLFAFIAVTVLFFMRDIMLLLANLTSFSEHISNTFNAMANIGIESFDDVSSLSVRVELYSMSINTFAENWKNLLVGVGYHSMENTLENGIGNHSQILDDMARYGLWGITLQIMLWASYLVYIKENVLRKINDKRLIYSLYIIYVLFVIMSILNNTYKPMTGLILFFVYPLLISIKGEDLNELTQREIKENCSF